jgi:hypothetical protein
MSGQWSGSGGNAPVGQRLFGGLGQLFGQQPGTAPSARAMAELEWIARSQGRLPPIDPLMLAGLLGAQEPLPVEMPQGRVPPSARPIDSTAMRGFEPPVRGATRGIDLPNMVVPGDIPPTVPPELDPSSIPQTPGARPEARASAAPQNPGEANWMALLQSYLPTRRQGTEEELRRLRVPRQPIYEPQSQPGMTGEQALQAYPDNPGVAAERPLMQPGQSQSAPADPQLPLPPEPPPGTDNVAAAAPGRTRYATFQGQLPTGQAALDAYNQGRPQERTRDPEERTLRLIAAALAGGMRETGQGVGGGAAAGLGAGYGAESDRDEALWQRSETERQRFQQGLAGLLGQQEQRQFDNMMSQQTFDRQSQALGDADARAREGLDIQRMTAGEQSLYRRMRMARLLQQTGSEAEPAQILSRGVEHVISRPGTQLLITDAEGRTRPLTIRLGDREMTLAQAQNELMRRRGDPRQARENPLFATNPQLALRQTMLDMGALLQDRILDLSPAQRMEVMRQMLPMIQSRARAGSQEIADE